MIKRMVKSLAMIGCMIFVGVNGFGCATGENNQTGYVRETIRINYTNSYGSSAIQIMKEKDFLTKYLPPDVSVEWVNLTSSNDQRDALVANQLDIGSLSSPNVISAIENELPLTLLAAGPMQAAVLYSNNAEIKDISDITADTKIATASLGNAYQLALMVYCEETMGNATRFEKNFFAISYADMFASMQTSHDIDCAIIGFPYIAQADASENLKPILSLTQIIRENNIGQYYAASEQFYDQNPALVEAFLAGMEETVDFMNDAPGEAAEVLTAFYPDIEAPSIIEKQIIEMPLKMDISESAYNNIASIMYEAGILSAEPKKFSELPNYDDILKTE